MSNTNSDKIQSKSNLKKWIINIAILIIATILVVVLAEGAMRWIDGYQMSTLDLQQDTSTTQEN
jgi:hypothetical protein